MPEPTDPPPAQRRPAVAIVPGLAVRRYLEGGVEALRAHGVDAWLQASPGDRRSTASVERQARGLARHLAERPVDLMMGFSLGTHVAARTATLCPGGAGAVVLVSPVAARTYPELGRRWLRAGRRESGTFVREQAGEWFHAPTRSLVRALRSARRHDLIEEADQARVPVHVVFGTHDPITSAEIAHRLTRGGGRTIAVPGATHSWPSEDARGLVDVVRGLLTDDDAR